jgi:zinc transport system ATP-binding protein
MLAVKAENLGIAFPGARIFQDVNFSIEKGSFIAVTGPNGSGKSTLLRILSKSIPASEGSVELFGVRLEHFRDWRKVAYIAQTPIQVNRRFPVTVQEVVAMGLVSRGQYCRPFLSQDDKRLIGEALGGVGMSGYAGKLLGQLSGGQRQKVFLARALVSGAELYLLDEPTSGIDATAKAEIYAFLRALNKETGNTIIMISHDMELASLTADRTLCLEAGGICYWGEAKDMLRHRHKGGYHFDCCESGRGDV